jgi:hypothetical protein
VRRKLLCRLEMGPVRLGKARGLEEEWVGAECKIIPRGREVIVSVPVAGRNFHIRPGRRARRGNVRVAAEDWLNSNKTGRPIFN